jgi:hypothetical protein
MVLRKGSRLRGAAAQCDKLSIYGRLLIGLFGSLRTAKRITKLAAHLQLSVRH